MALFWASPGLGLIFFLLCFILNLHWTQGLKIQQKEKEILDNLLKNYDLRIRPTGVNSTTDTAATVVTLNHYILAINKVDDRHMDFSIQMYFRQSWNDERFRFNDMGGSLKSLSLNDPSKIWTPDIFFTNEKKGFIHDLVKPNAFLRIYPNGNILYSQRLSLTLSCPMDLAWFPFDKQVCIIRFESYGMSYSEMRLEWKADTPVAVGDVGTNSFSLAGFSTTESDVTLSTGKYSILHLNLQLKRLVHFYLIQLFIPSAMLVVISWITFWLDRGAITARVVLAAATLLTLANHASTFSANNAQVSYTKASDIWLGVCLTFLFAALIETAVVHYWHRVEEKHEKKAVGDKVGDEEAIEGPVKVAVTYQARSEPATVHVQEGNGTQSKLRLKQRATDLKSRLANVSTNSKRLDIISRILFPIGFALFAIVYWITTLLHYAVV